MAFNFLHRNSVLEEKYIECTESDGKSEDMYHLFSSNEFWLDIL